MSPLSWNYVFFVDERLGGGCVQLKGPLPKFSV
jgi:hypothetical protein